MDTYKRNSTYETQNRNLSQEARQRLDRIPSVGLFSFYDDLVEYDPAPRRRSEGLFGTYDDLIEHNS